jgi:O-antigen/teichoic acid export membrane protein
VLTFADLGIGNGLMNAVAGAHGRNDRPAAAVAVSSAFFVLLGIAAVLGLAFLAIYPLVPWPRVFNVSEPKAVAEAGPAVAAFASCFLVKLPLGLVQRIQMGYQEGFVYGLWEASGKVLGLVAVLAAIWSGAGLSWLVLAMAGAPATAMLLNGAVLLGLKRPWLLPRWKNVTSRAARRIADLGFLFLALQVLGAIATSSNSLILAHVLGQNAVARFCVVDRLFGLVLMLLGLFVAPLWPAYGEALSRGDALWIKRTLVRSLKLSLLITVPVSSLLILFGGSIVVMWVGPELRPSFWFLAGFGLKTVAWALGAAVAMLLNGISVLRFQVAVASAFTVAALLGKVFLARRFGVAGLVWATGVCYVAFALIPYCFYVPRLVARLRPRTRQGRTPAIVSEGDQGSVSLQLEGPA